MTHKHSLYDSDMHFLIDTTSRSIKNQTKKTIIVRGDHNSERFTFEMPRIIEGHDMSLCNLVQVHYINASFPDVDKIEDLTVYEEDDTLVVFSWQITENATQFDGNLSFAIHFYCIADNGTVDYSYRTIAYKEITVADTIDNAEAIKKEYPNILAEWEARLDALEQNGGSGGSIDVDLSNYVTTNMMPDIDIDKVIEEKTGTENYYQPITEGWIDNKTTSVSNGYSNNNYVCVTPLIKVMPDARYKAVGALDTLVMLYDYDGNYIESQILDSGVFDTIVDDIIGYVRFGVFKELYGGTLDLSITIENFNNEFQLLLFDRYKLKDNVELPDNIEIPNVPTKVSQLENDSGYITADELPDYPDVDTPEIPTKVSQLENDAGFITIDDIPETSGIYVGSGEMPDGYNVQIDPNGDAVIIPTKLSELENDKGYITADDLPEVPETPEGIITEDRFETQAENEEPTYGEELASADGWTSDGWTGDFLNGFTHTTGNTNSLVFTMPEDTAQNTYRISFRCSESIDVEALMVRCGNSDLFDLYGQPYNPVTLGIASVENGNLEFVPASTFKGTITDISIKRVTGFNATKQTITDSTGEISCEMRTTKSSLENLFIGKYSGENNISGVGCVAVGSSALKNNTSGFWNVGVGLNALRDNTVGSRNIGIGYIALAENITGTRNIAIGTFALNHNKTGNKNIAIGSDCLDHNVSGSFNVGIGFQTLYSNVIGNQNTAIGAMALKAVTGNANVGIGYSAGAAITTGSNNFALGVNSLYKLKTGNDNIAIGAQAGRGQATTTGFNYVICIGRQTGYNLGNNANANIFIGNKAGYSVTTGGDNICIGSDADTPTPTTSRWVNIGGLYEGSAKATDKYAKINGGLQLSDIPTSDPAIAGRVWNDNGTLKVSVG